MGLVATCDRLSDVGDSIGDRGPDMLTGVGMFEFEVMDDVRSCLIGTCATCIVVVSGKI
jgi:hypothetical protein